VTRGRFRRCDAAWCGKCFTPHELDPCDIAVPKDFDGATLDELEEKRRFMEARPGDHLCASFQCPNCQSQNIRGRDLVPDNITDECFKSLCTRATLDAFWAHSTNTIAGHVREVKYLTKYGSALGFEALPPLGPFPLGEHRGMLQAIVLEMRALEKGKRNETVMFGTARMIRSTTTVLWENSPVSGSDIVLSSGGVKGRYIATLCPSESRWYESFTVGVSSRKGDVVRQDRAYTIEVVHAMMDMWESEFQEHGYAMPLRSMEACMFFLISCTGGFRGFETVWTDLGALVYDLEYCEEREDFSAVSWPVTGRFKNQHGMWGHYYIPIAGLTGSGLQVFRWTQRFVIMLRKYNRTTGWAFRKEDNTTRATASDYAEEIYGKLEHLQNTTCLIDARCCVREDYGMMRSGRRFFDTHCLNMKVSPTDIAFQCRWQQDRAKGGATVHRSMIHTYAEIRNMKPTLLRPSQAL